MFFVGYFVTLCVLAAVTIRQRFPHVQQEVSINPMNIPLDKPLFFESASCRVCKLKDDNWRLVQLCHDGVWRCFTAGQTLRENGIDGLEEALYFVHACCEKFLYECQTREAVEEFFMLMRE